MIISTILIYSQSALTPIVKRFFETVTDRLDGRRTSLASPLSRVLILASLHTTSPVVVGNAQLGQVSKELENGYLSVRFAEITSNCLSSSSIVPMGFSFLFLRLPTFGDGIPNSKQGTRILCQSTVPRNRRLGFATRSSEL